MCRYRQVQNTFTLCGHFVREPDVMLYCDDRWCKFSAAHPANCGPKCRETCWQRRQFPEQYTPEIVDLCPACRQAAVAAAAAAARAQAQGGKRY